MSDDHSPLASYLLALCKSQSLTMRQASIQSGLDPSTIAKIVQRSKYGGGAEPATLQTLADHLNGDFQRMMVLAGHLDAPLEIVEGADDDELAEEVLLLHEIWRKIRRLDPQVADQLAAATISSSRAYLDGLTREQERRKEGISRD